MYEDMERELSHYSQQKENVNISNMDTMRKNKRGHGYKVKKVSAAKKPI
jgi:hypothetical protein